MSAWEQHVKCTQLIRQHPDWTDEQVLDGARMHKLEMNIVQEARREVEGETLGSDVKSDRTY